MGTGLAGCCQAAARRGAPTGTRRLAAWPAAQSPFSSARLRTFCRLNSWRHMGKVASMRSSQGRCAPEASPRLAPSGAAAARCCERRRSAAAAASAASLSSSSRLVSMPMSKDSPSG